MLETSHKPDLAHSSVFVVGDVMLDRYWFGDVKRISPEAPVPIALIKKEDYRLGGAANVARNIASLGGGVNILGIVGADEAAQQLEELLQQSQICSSLIKDPSLSTILKLRVVGHSQQLLRIDFENSLSEHHLNALKASYCEQIKNHKVVVFSDYGKGALSEIAEYLRNAQALGVTTLVDPKGSDYSRYLGANVLTPNRNELKAVIGDWQSEGILEQRAQNLRREMQWQHLVLTRSEEGLTLFNDEGAFHIATQAQEVFDVSGAGDTVIATLSLLLASGYDILSALKLANRAAGIVVAKMGTATLSADELFTPESE